MDQHVHDTYFIVAHFHFIMVGGMVLGLLRGAALLVAEDDGQAVLAARGAGWRRCSSSSASCSRSCRSSSSGYLGMPRRYHQYPPEFQVLNVMSSAGASILAAGYLLPFVYLLLLAAVGASRPGRTPGARPGWSGRRPRRRRRTTSRRRRS